MNAETLDRIEYLTRNLERGRIISVLRQKLINCDEDQHFCDVCLGIRYAIYAIEERME